MEHLVLGVLKNSVLITGLVIMMMIMIEYVNIYSKGAWFSRLKGNPAMQVIVASLLGLVPGCIGGFATVSLYTHGIISFGAIVAMMISSSGDEAFVMLAMMPATALLLFAILFAIAIVTGILTDKAFKKTGLAGNKCDLAFEVHKNETLPSPFRKKSYAVLKNISAKRLLILLFMAFFSVAVFSGLIGHDHAAASAPDGHLHMDILGERWINVIFAALCCIVLLFTLTADEHFVEEHLWHHIISKHMMPVFLWTFGALFAVQAGLAYFNADEIISDNIALVLLLAVLIGMIPESGPHMVFIGLFSAGAIPLSILLANSIVQDGHSTLPLLAHNKKDFITAKLINMAVGLVVGGTMLFFGM